MKDQREQQVKDREISRAAPARPGSRSHSYSHGSSTIDGPADALLTQAGRGAASAHKGADSSDVLSHGTQRQEPPSPAGPGAISSPGQQLQEHKASSERHERRVARLLGGQRIPGSGSLGEVGDVKTDEFLVSCKRTTLQSRKFGADIIDVWQQAESSPRSPAVVYEFTSLPEHIEKDWALVPLRFLAALSVCKE